jgi:hypothetical protein
VFKVFEILERIERKLNFLGEQMSTANQALTDLQAAQAAIAKAVSDAAADIKALAAQLVPGVDPNTVEAIAQDLNAKATALEAAIVPPPAPPTQPAS